MKFSGWEGGSGGEKEKEREREREREVGGRLETGTGLRERAASLEPSSCSDELLPGI
jgi:hypothetical protein